MCLNNTHGSKKANIILLISAILRQFPIISEASEDYRGFPKIAKDFRRMQKMSEDQQRSSRRYIHMWKEYFWQCTDTIFYTKNPPNTKQYFLRKQ